METASPITISAHARKRTKTQREADLVFIEAHVVRGCTQAEIVNLLAAVRPYRIGRSQVSMDIALMRARWREDSSQFIGHEMATALRKLDHLESEAWDAWDKSKEAGTRTTLTKKAGGKVGAAGDGAAETKSAVQVSSAGDPAFLGKILDIQDRRAKLLGLYAPVKSELSGPAGGVIPIANVGLSEEDQDALLRRHFERMKEDEDSGAGAQPASEAAVG